MDWLFFVLLFLLLCWCCVSFACLFEIFYDGVCVYVSFDWSIYHGCLVVIDFAMVIRERPQCMTKIYKKNSDVLLTAKAFNGRVILEWLCDETYRFSQQEEAEAFDSRVYHIAAALNHDCYIAFPFFVALELMLFELLTCVTSYMHIRVHDVWKFLYPKLTPSMRSQLWDPRTGQGNICLDSLGSLSKQVATWILVCKNICTVC